MSTADHQDIYDCGCFRLRAAARKVTRDFEEALKPVNLRATQFTLLFIINDLKPDAITALANAVCMDRTALNRALSVMSKHGWVTVEKTGAREKQVRITEAGRDLLNKAIPCWRAAQNKFIEKADQDDWADHRHWLIGITDDKSDCPG